MAEDLRHYLSVKGHMFAYSYGDLGCLKGHEHVISPNCEKPIYQHPYRKSIKERDEMKKEVGKMLDAGIIRESRSPCSAPVVMVTKKDGSMRFCINYKAINAVTTQDKFPLPRIYDIFDRMAGSAWCTGIDLKCGYWQIKVAEKSIPMTAFSTPDGHYECLRLPFGLKNAPADFSRAMQQALGDLPFVQIYLDDITIHSKTLEEHMEHINEVFGRLEEMNMKINLKKCTWCKTEAKILGFLLSGEGVKVDPAKIEAIKNMKPPTSVKQAQCVLGCFNYFNILISLIAVIGKPSLSLSILIIFRA